MSDYIDATIMFFGGLGALIIGILVYAAFTEEDPIS